MESVYMNNILAIIVSFVYISIVIGIAAVLQKKQVLQEEGARKFIHIGVSNWWFLVLFLFDSLWFAIIPPIVFIILNFISYKVNLIKTMERNGKGSLGTVYFPVSLLFLVFFSFAVQNPYIGGMGIFIMGYGDGLAAVIGKKYGRHHLLKGKTLEGSLTMFLTSVIVAGIVVFFGGYFPVFHALLVILVIALVSTVIELCTPRGLDNITVPITASVVFYILINLV